MLLKLDASSDHFVETSIKYQYIEMRLHWKETVERLSFLTYQKLVNKGHLNNHDFCLFLPFQTTSKEARWSCVDFPFIETISKMYIKITPIIRPSKLHQNLTSKWREICRCWHVDIISKLVRHVEFVGVTEQKLF